MESVVGRFRTQRLAACALGVGIGLLLVVLSYLPGAPIYPGGLVAVLFVSIFPLFGWAVIERSSTAARRPRRRWNDSRGITNEDYNRAWKGVFDFARRYRTLLLVGVLVVIGLWVSMISTIPTLQGQPTHDSTGYYLNDHGSHIPVSKAGYEKAVAAQDRLFAAGATLFLVVAGALTAYKPTPRSPQPQTATS